VFLLNLTGGFPSWEALLGLLTGYLGKPVATNAMTVMASSAAPKQSHCERAALGSSSFISPSPSA